MIKRLIKKIISNYPGDKNYWNHRYLNGGNSGAGSYNRLAEFKAGVINEFISNNKIEGVIDFGCGDGNVTSLLKVNRYVGLDISEIAISRCKEIFKSDPNKEFLLYNRKPHVKKEALTISLDVLFHLTENNNYYSYLTDLFESSSGFVIIYSRSDIQEINNHVRDRAFIIEIQKLFPNWKLVKTIRNKYPFDPQNEDITSRSDFFIFRKLDF